MSDENFPLFTRSRAEDPETSKQAAAQVKPRLNQLQQDVVAILDRNPAGLTDLEIAQKLGDTKRSTYRTRRAELVELGDVVWTGHKKTVEGSKRRVWALRKYHAGVSVPETVKTASTAPNYDLVAHLERQIAFSRRAFGPNAARQVGVADHIRRELDEVAKADGPYAKLKEWFDVIILGTDGAWRAICELGLTDRQIALAITTGLDQKLAKNERRDWPDWRGKDDQAIEHVRGKED